MLAVAFSAHVVMRAILLHRPSMPGTGVLRAPARNLVASAGPALPSDTASCHQLLCVRRKVMSMTHAFFYLFTSSGSCRVFDSSCPDVLMLRCQRLADTALALLLRVKLTDPAPDGTFAKRHSLCGLRQRLFMIFRCSLSPLTRFEKNLSLWPFESDHHTSRWIFYTANFDSKPMSVRSFNQTEQLRVCRFFEQQLDS